MHLKIDRRSQTKLNDDCETADQLSFFRSHEKIFKS
jgi:hypothetical protein